MYARGSGGGDGRGVEGKFLRSCDDVVQKVVY